MSGKRGKNTTPTTGFGRPKDEQIQTEFMKRLRGPKLQAINAQSEAELICFYQSDEKKKKNQSEGWKEKVLFVRKMFSDKNNNDQKFDQLWQSFKLGSEKWQFKEIKSKNDFPEYLFDDECDLSYVLWFALKGESSILKTKKQFYPDELLFFELICFSMREMISLSTLNYIHQKYQQIIEMMKNVRSAVQKHFNENDGNIQDEKNKLTEEEIKRQKIMEDVEGEREKDIDEKDLELGGEYVERIKLCNQEVKGSELSVGKKKIIKKEGRQRGRPRNSAQDRDEEEGDEQLGDLQNKNNLVKKLIMHIAWCYRYVFREELLKRKRIENEQMILESN